MKWYVVHTYSGFEEKAKLSLLERARSQGMHEKIGEIHIPHTVSEAMNKSGKKRQVAKTSFPGYIIVQMELDDETMHLVKNTPKITGFVGNAKLPRALPDHEVLKITNPDAVKTKTAVVAEVQFAKGEHVKVTDGPFSSFDGVIDEVRPDKARIRVLVSIFGRETPVDLDFGQVQKSG